jgi:hypothetical protein
MIELSKLNNLIDNGYSILFADEQKRPVCQWKKLQEQAYSKEDLATAYANQRNDLAGLITGYNNLEVIDIDLKVFTSLQDQNDFWKEYLQFLKDNIDDFDKKFVIYKTKNKGYHILYKCKTIVGNSKLAKLKGHKECIIETRGTGGYVVIYENNQTDLLYANIQEISEEDRSILWDCSKTYNYILEEPVKLDNFTTNSTEKELTPWDDYNEKTSIFDILGSEFSIPYNGVKSKFTLIKRDGGTSPHSGYVYNDSGCMYLFSTGTIYPHEKLISPFAAYTYKFHNGDFKSAASDLYSKGFGSRRKQEVIQKGKDILKQYDKPKINKSDLVFPIDVFPESIQVYINECNKKLDSSIDYMGCSMLWVTSVIIGNSANIQVKTGWLEPASIWISIVGKAGIGKTPSINNIVFPLQKINSKEIKDYIKKEEKFEAYEKLTKDEKNQHEKISKPTRTQFIADDITLEALIDLHQDSKNSVGVFKDELAGWLKDMNKYRAGSDLEFWLSSWSGKSYNSNRKTAKSSFVDKPFVPVLGGIQPSIFNSFYTDENKDNGFMDRMLLCYPELSVDKWNDEELTSDVIDWYRSAIITFYEYIKKSFTKLDEEMDIVPNLFRFSKEAKIEFERIFNRITDHQNNDDENEYMKSMLPKQKSYIPRFALLIDVMNKVFNNVDCNEDLFISKESVLKAEKLSNYFIANAKKIKINSTEMIEYKKIINKNEGVDKFSQFKKLYEANNELNKKEVAELLGVSRKCIYEWVKKV